MENLMKIIESIDKCYKGTKLNEEAIRKAENQLGLEFSNSYKVYLKEYGSLSFYGTELTGITGAKNDDVVFLTEKLRKKDNELNTEYYVVEDLASDGIIMLSNKDDEIYEYVNGKISKKFNSLADYIKKCKNRK